MSADPFPAAAAGSDSGVTRTNLAGSGCLATDSLIAGEHLGDPGSELSLLACMVCTTLLGAALVAGWWRKRS